MMHNKNNMASTSKAKVNVDSDKIHISDDNMSDLDNNTIDSDDEDDLDASCLQ